MISNALYNPNAVYDHERYMLVVKDCMRCFMQIIEVIVSAHPQSRLVVQTCAACSNFSN